MRLQVVLAIAVLVLAAGRAEARDETDPYDAYRSPADSSEGFSFDDSLVEKWKEQQVAPPPLSEDGLQEIRIDHGPPGRIRYFVDLENLTANPKDGVVRYWLVMESGGQRTNILFEGIRCSDRKYKTYAYASLRRPSLVKYVDAPEWQEIRGLGSDDFRYELAEEYFCALGSPRSMQGIAAAAKGYVDTTNPNLQDADFIKP